MKRPHYPNFVCCNCSLSVVEIDFVPPAVPINAAAENAVATDDPNGNSRGRVLVAVLVWASFLLFSGIQSPVPGVNEPHYLTKAKHYWQPDWCAGDFFLESANTHIVFYQTIGQLTRWLSFDQAAWVGRSVVLLLLAVGWTKLVARLLAPRWSPLWVAWVFLLLQSLGNFSGEWMVGGVEAKVVAYGLSFWALALVSDRHWRRAGVCMGLAISFHPVVGVWSLLCLGMAVVMLKLLSRSSVDAPDSDARQHGVLPSVRDAVVVLGLLVLFALPGLVPALQLLGGVTDAVEYRANFIQVFFRLQHHLDPMQFPPSAYAMYGLLVVFWLVRHRSVTSSRQETVFWWFVIGSLIIATAGLAIGWNARPTDGMPGWLFQVNAFRMKLMKFYPFRLFDMMVPLAASVVFIGALDRFVCRRMETTDGLDDGQQRTSKQLGSVPIWIAAFAFAGALVIAALHPNSGKVPEAKLAEWLEVCQWISDETPADALFWTSDENWAFKWYAERAEFVVFKDCPQDAAGIVEWNRRLEFLHRWAQVNFDNGYSAESLRRLHEETGITHIVAERLGPFDADTVFQNRRYRVCEISRLP